MKKTLNRLFYTGLLIVLFPTLLLISTILYATLGSSDPIEKTGPTTPTIEKKIVYDTVKVRVEIPVQVPIPVKEKKKEVILPVDSVKINKEDTIK